MTRLLPILLLLFPLAGVGDTLAGATAKGARVSAAAGGAAWYDDFDSADNTDLTANCGARIGPNGDCGWLETDPGGDPNIFTNYLQVPLEANSIVYTDTDVNTLAQYSGATAVTDDRYIGVMVRYNTATDCSYVFAWAGAGNMLLQAVDSDTPASSTLETIIVGGDDFPDMATGDGWGMSVTADTGNSVKFTLYQFDQAGGTGGVPPLDFDDWAGNADVVHTVCAAAGGCDDTWDIAPEAATCTPDAGKKIGIQSVLAFWGNYDNWAGGDI